LTNPVNRIDFFVMWIGSGMRGSEELGVQVSPYYSQAMPYAKKLKASYMTHQVNWRGLLLGGLEKILILVGVKPTYG
jgi:hypothetical protein